MPAQDPELRQPESFAAPKRAPQGAFSPDEGLNRRILEAVPAGIVHLGMDHTLREANGVAVRMFGLREEDVRGLDPRTLPLIREDGGPYAAEELPASRAMATGEPQPAVTMGVRVASGKVRWLSVTAVPVWHPETGECDGAVVTFFDVTQRREAQEALRHSEARLRSIVESAPNIILTGDREGRITFVNRTTPPFTPQQVIGRPVLDFTAPADTERIRGYLQRVLTDGETVAYEAEGPVPVDGSYFSVSVGPIRSGEAITGFTMIIWDITEQKELRTRVMMSDRMASVGTLAAGVAHEINNPLTYVMNHLGLARRRLRPDMTAPELEALAQRLEEAAEGAERIRSIVRDLSTFSRGGDAERVPVALREVLDSVVRMAQHELRYRARVRREDADVPKVLAHPSRLGQVFLNLLVNAAHAIPEGDVDGNEVTIRTYVDPAGRVVAEVSDTGSGIPADLLGRIFAPFVTTKAVGQGTGLGLYICHNIVTSLGGELLVDSTPGVGTTFRVVLPRASEEAAPSSGAVEVSRRPVTRRARILVVDDEVGIRQMFRAALPEHDVTVAESGRAAVRLLAEQDYDVVFCDLIMPDLTGMDLYEHLRQERPGKERSCVFMTAGAFTEGAREFLDRVSIELLEKPFDLPAIERVLDARLKPR